MSDPGFTVDVERLAFESAVIALAVAFGISMAMCDDEAGSAGVAVPDAGCEVREMRWTSRRAVKISSSVNIENGSRLLRTVPVNSVGSGSN